MDYKSTVPIMDHCPVRITESAVRSAVSLAIMCLNYPESDEESVFLQIFYHSITTKVLDIDIQAL